MKNGDTPASPCSEEQTITTEDGYVTTVYNEKQSFGLTKREHFAAMVMQGILSSGISMELGPSHPKNNKDIAVCAATIADALLKALENDK